MDKLFLTHRRSLRRGRVGVPAIAVCVLGLGCTAFNPAFLDLLDTEQIGLYARTENVPGHVAIAFVNNAEVDERLIAYLESAEGGNLVLTDAEKQALRPRMRLHVLVTYTNGETRTIEFIDGSSELVEGDFNAESLPDLNQNDLNRVTVVCDVARVEVVDPIEVFIPVSWSVYDWVEATGFAQGYYRLAYTQIPHFFALRVDDVDADLNTLRERNIGIRDVPSPVDDVLCGSVVAIAVDGVLSVPFFRVLSGAPPGWSSTDLLTAAGVGGRYEFMVTIH